MEKVYIPTFCVDSMLYLTSKGGLFQCQQLQAKITTGSSMPPGALLTVSTRNRPHVPLGPSPQAELAWSV